MQVLEQPVVSFVVGGNTIPCSHYTLRLASHGSLADLDTSTSLALVNLMGVNLPSLGDSNAELSLTAGYVSSGTKKLFAGYFDKHKITAHEDKVCFKGRDWAADLVDRKIVLAGMNLRNQTVGQIVTQIANQFGLTPNVTDPGILAGATFKNETTLTTHPQPPWSILKHFADQVGYDFKCNPDKSLFFGPIGSDQGTLNVTWKAGPKDPFNNPLKTLSIAHSPRRNGNFEVHVLSYDPWTNQMTSATASYSSQQFSGKMSKKGAYQSRKNSHLTINSDDDSGSDKKVVLTFHSDGLTAEQCEARAKGIANDIAKREILIEGTILGLNSVGVHQTLQISAPTDPLGGYENRPYTIMEVTHSFSKSEGFKTDFIACSEPTSD